MADLTAVRGDTNEYDLTFTRLDTTQTPAVAVPLDLTGATIVFTLKRNLDDADVDAVLQKTAGAGIAVTDAANGEALLTLNPADTTDLPAPRAFHYDVQVTESDGRVTTTAIGLLRLTADVERS
jgi:hypothetical protein